MRFSDERLTGLVLFVEVASHELILQSVEKDHSTADCNKYHWKNDDGLVKVGSGARGGRRGWGRL
eukprot:CAMPEP_0197854236 /NCGR_PEP_ID=MMETSP1438-20131217/24300_1 /TAXON_ID=1461541 /ORGANISM="Pterosperma sp., Strain CCMP1384" /LENGTH=64 /DNA_ID=CAMNT_0043468905 /DNA_START=1052 /DNA_END=1242 /DNA_ORIENTATION=-